jgi:hypothetical protein
MPKTLKASRPIHYRRVASQGYTRQAAEDLPLEDKGDDSNIYTTDALPESGHSRAIDDDQQPYRSAALLDKVATTVDKVGEKAIARRLRVLAHQTRKATDLEVDDNPKQWGIRDTNDYSGQLYSTEYLNDTAGPFGADQDRAIDEDQKGGTLEFYGTYPPRRSQTGPKPRGASHRKAKAGKRRADPLDEYKDRVTTAIEQLDDDTYETQENDFHQLAEDLESMVDVGDTDNDGDNEDDNVDDNLDDNNGDTDDGAVTDVGDGLPDAMPKVSASRRKANANQSAVWATFKHSLKRTASRGGRWGSGDWDLGTEDLGKVVDLQLNTRGEDGSPLVANTLTFSLIREDPKTRTATIEVADPVLTHETRQFEVPIRLAKRFAQDWAEKTERAAKDILNS